MRRQRRDEPRPKLNLAPIMNMVVILIPLLLLSVVFLSVGVINVTAPPKGPIVADSSEKDEPLNVTVAISEHGFIVSTRDGVRPSVAGCAKPEMTVCLEDRQTRPGEVFASLYSMPAAAQQQAIDELVGAYDFASLYKVLDDIKTEHPGESRIIVTASPDVPYALVTRVMDAARFRVEPGDFSSSRDFWRASRSTGSELFPDPIVAVAR